MLDPKLLDDLAEKLAAAVPTGVRDLQNDLEKNFRAILQGAFTKLNLVTREEFEVQTALLARTRAKLDELDREVQRMEVQLRPSEQSAAPPHDVIP